MEGVTVVKFIRFIRKNPDLARDRDKFVSSVEESSEELIRLKTELLRIAAEEEKNDLIQCFDIWDKFTKENNIDIVHADNTQIEQFLINAVSAFGLVEDKRSAE